jgi:hypothetical protein
MKIAISIFLAATVGTALTLAPQPLRAFGGGNCGNADPSLVLANVSGDFEITADPQDAAHSLIYISNVAKSGPSTVVTAHIGNTTGQVMSGSLTQIADNFDGNSAINGPEFVWQPTGQFGVLYTGVGGVHGVFRASVPTAWNAFNFDVSGAPTNGSPPALPTTSDGAYPGADQKLDESTYAQNHGTCSGICYSALTFGIPTDVAAVATANFGLTGSAATGSPRDGYVFMGACDTTGSCGIYEGLIDNNGGFVAGTFQKRASVATAPADLGAARHPLTGSTVLFASHGSNAIDVWQQPASGGALSLVASVPVNTSAHYRPRTSNTEVVLHYYGASTLATGSYTIPVSAKNGALVAGSSTKISSYGSGSDLAWLPAAGEWALFYRPSPTTNALTRCWVNPSPSGRRR